MIENKYYTPELEEFHVGFEFEAKDLSDNGQTFVWREQIYAGEEMRTYLTDEIKLKEIRVKHLDQQDIEGCGWKKSAEHKELYSINWIENPDEKKNAIWMAKVSENKYQITDCRHTWHFVLFAGIIKNKSELKRIIKMIGI